METHLNLLNAHRSMRKAELYTKCHQFSETEAIFHFQKASEYLGKAILGTKCDNIRASLIIQRNFNIDQIDFLKRRQYKKIRKEFDRDKSKTSDVLFFRPLFTMNSEEHEQKYQELFHVMSEQNSLLNYLIGQKHPDAQSGTDSSNRSSPTNELKFKSGNRKPKEDKEIIEELNTVNEKLKNWVHHLVENLEKAQQEIHGLKDENSQLQKELSAMKASFVNCNANQAIPELPPLEPPKLLY